ncbi:MAG: Stealth CR1 domain-containing protein [Balneola sp.]
MKFDIVYTWVDGSSMEYIKKWNSYAKIKKDTNPERYRDTFQLLKYSIRSIEKYFNSFNKLYIITASPQVPEWCDLNNDRIQLVHHDEFIPEQYLPTFNSNVIESFLHRIPGLADDFVYMNDDFLFGEDTSIERFYNDGKYTIFNTFFGENLRWRVYDGYRDLIGLGIIEHTPILINKEFWGNAFNLFPDEAEATRRCKFRDDRNFFPYKLYRYYMLKYQRELSRPIPITELIKISKFHKLTNNLKKQKNFFSKMEQGGIEFYCLNDDMGESPNKAVVELVKEFLNYKYPNPSFFELKKDSE